MEVLFATALRVSEVLDIRLEHISWEEKKIWLPESNGEDASYGPVTARCESWMKKYLAYRQMDSPFLFAINMWVSLIGLLSTIP
jgi:site-specific recombinase XerD